MMIARLTSSLSPLQWNLPPLLPGVSGKIFSIARGILRVAPEAVLFGSVIHVAEINARKREALARKSDKVRIVAKFIVRMTICGAHAKLSPKVFTFGFISGGLIAEMTSNEIETRFYRLSDAISNFTRVKTDAHLSSTAKINNIIAIVKMVARLVITAVAVILASPPLAYALTIYQAAKLGADVYRYYVLLQPN